MNIYDKNGYLNMGKLIDIDVPFIFIVGARGIGKTYGAIMEMRKRNEIFMLMRRTQTQADLISKHDFSPLISPLNDLGESFVTTPISKQCCACNIVYPDETVNPTPFCYTGALSTLSNMRGFDASHINYLIYDEFIPEPNERPIKEEAKAFFNGYETMNRNRELKGQNPLKAVLLANSFNMANPLFIQLGLVMRTQNMLKRHNEVFIDKNRGLALIVPQESPISSRKRQTALYKLTQDSDYSLMALDNEFIYDTPDNVDKRRLIEYYPIVTIGEITIYKHKSDGTYYVSEHVTGSPKDIYTMSDNDRKRFVRKYNYLWQMFMKNKLFFESYLCQVLFDKTFAL